MTSTITRSAPATKLKLAGAVIAAATVVLVPPALAYADSQQGGQSATSPGHTKTTASPTPNPRPTSSGPGQSDHRDGNASTQGSVSSPQPFSTADSTNHGANTTSSTNPYRSTRNGAASGNGRGSGHAYGKPCAGCVGKADNKNPHGQQPNGTDGNAGYECDSNHGIGQTNPAHTGCVSTTPSSTPSTPPPSCTSGCQSLGGVLTPPMVAGSTRVGGTVVSGVPGVPGVPGVTQVLGERVVKTPRSSTSGVPSTTPRATSALPFTGADVALMLTAALGLLLLGGVAVTFGRRRRSC